MGPYRARLNDLGGERLVAQAADIAGAPSTPSTNATDATDASAAGEQDLWSLRVRGGRDAGEVRQLGW